MEKFGFIDYKQPMGDEMDMRTSTYLGHKYITDASTNYNMHSQIKEIYKYEPDPVLENDRKLSDYEENFVWKFGDPSLLRNPSLGGKIDFIKPFDDMKLKFVKRDMKPAASVSHQDYIWNPVPLPPAPQLAPMSTPIKTTPIVMDRSKLSYCKYLDPSATTYRLDFVSRTPEELMASVAAKDNITFWNWHKHHHPAASVSSKTEDMCENLPSRQCPKRHDEFISLVKRVPHTGMTTEVRANYLAPHLQEVEDKSPLLKNILTFTEVVPATKKTEYNMYGSGERIEKYV